MPDPVIHKKKFGSGISSIQCLPLYKIFPILMSANYNLIQILSASTSEFAVLKYESYSKETDLTTVLGERAESIKNSPYEKRGMHLTDTQVTGSLPQGIIWATARTTAPPWF
jgi:hypothetical protein